MTAWIEIDGSVGEGGGQILRTSLALSLITGKPFRMSKIRAGRPKPGLRRQHVACVEAAAALGADVRGAEVDSAGLEFVPNGAAAPAEIAVDIGSAGSTTLVVQTILLPALLKTRGLRATITGGTHNPMAPPFEFLDRVFLPRLAEMGAACTLTLAQPGFVPDGGGELVLETQPASALRPLDILEGGDLVAMRSIAIIARLPQHVADREHGIAREYYGDRIVCDTVAPARAPNPANVYFVEAELASGARELTTSFGEKGLRAEVVAERACEALEDFLELDIPVGEHLADQLLLPLALASGTSRFRCGALSLHATTNIETIAKFLDCRVTTSPLDDDCVEVRIDSSR